MPRPTKNLKGKIFGELRVLARASDKCTFRGGGSVRNAAAWTCLCSCGREKIIAASNLLGGRSTSCGPCAKQKPGAAFRQVFQVYKCGAIRRGYGFFLTEEQVRVLFSLSCYYCGAPPGNKSTAVWKDKPEILIYSGIDRQNNSMDYVSDNCVPCCSECNRSKGTRSEKEFVDHCKKVAGRFS